MLSSAIVLLPPYLLSLRALSLTLRKNPNFRIAKFYSPIPCEPLKMSPTPPSIVAEYAKSSRSKCKKCSKTIAANALRLGSVSWDSRGFEMIKWHHLDCFAFKSDASVESIKGFDSLKSSDQEALKNFTTKVDRDEEEVIEGEKAVDEDKERRPKRQKVEISLSVSDIKDKYKDASLLPKWKAFQTIIFLEKDDDLQDSSKIAAFDFDGCLVNTSVKRIGADAWSLMFPSIPEKLQKMHSDGYKLVLLFFFLRRNFLLIGVFKFVLLLVVEIVIDIFQVIFTNESNIERWKNKRQVAVDSKLGRLNNFIKRVKVPIQVFVACGFDKSGGKGEDPYRKPRPGMWHIMEKHFNSGIPIDMDKSFYVGDAAGREKDHSDADIKFAKAIGLKFYVPEEFFTD